ncbi:hypothetical protein JNM87_03085 [Candidatus Saccharibacteria bacterium]|nr:hypothetical protein [Candidatus Saccharibacteria bacterium]
MYLEGRPLFLEAYYGRVYNTQITAQEVYGFLRLALQHAAPDRPFRGPAEYDVDGELMYRCLVDGNVRCHAVDERIFENGVEIYSATITGGLVPRQDRFGGVLVSQTESDAL